MLFLLLLLAQVVQDLLKASGVGDPSSGGRDTARTQADMKKSLQNIANSNRLSTSTLASIQQIITGLQVRTLAHILTWTSGEWRHWECRALSVDLWDECALTSLPRPLPSLHLVC